MSNKIRIDFDPRVTELMNNIMHLYRSLAQNLTQSLEINKSKSDYTPEEVAMIASISILDSLLDNGHEVLTEAAQGNAEVKVFTKALFKIGENCRLVTERMDGEMHLKVVIDKDIQ